MKQNNTVNKCCRLCWHCRINDDNKTGLCTADIGDPISDIDTNTECNQFDYDNTFERY